jgi:hypothetical protein
MSFDQATNFLRLLNILLSEPFSTELLVRRISEVQQNAVDANGMSFDKAG